MAYKLPINRDESNSNKILKEHETAFNAEMKAKMALNLDRAGGAGTSNDANTARRSFAKPAQAASILGSNERFLGLLPVVCS